MRFGMSGMRCDLGQNTIPFLDTQEVVTRPPLPHSGAGIYHKRTADTGGFLGLKLLHYNFVQHKYNTVILYLIYLTYTKCMPHHLK